MVLQGLAMKHIHGHDFSVVTGSTKLQNAWAEMFGHGAEELIGAFYRSNRDS